MYENKVKYCAKILFLYVEYPDPGGITSATGSPSESNKTDNISESVSSDMSCR